MSNTFDENPDDSGRAVVTLQSEDRRVVIAISHACSKHDATTRNNHTFQFAVTLPEFSFNIQDDTLDFVLADFIHALDDLNQRLAGTATLGFETVGIRLDIDRTGHTTWQISIDSAPGVRAWNFAIEVHNDQTTLPGTLVQFRNLASELATRP